MQAHATMIPDISLQVVIVGADNLMAAECDHPTLIEHDGDSCFLHEVHM